MTQKSILPILFAAALAVLFGARASAVTTIWDGGAPVGNTNWNTAANWVGDIVPLATHDVQFGSGFASGTTIETNGNRTANSLIINTATPISFSGDVLGFDLLTLTSGNVTSITATTTVIDVDLALGANGTWSIPGNLHVSRLLGETAPGRGLTKTGAGRLSLHGGGSYTGPTFISQGILELGNSFSATGPMTLAPDAKLSLINATVATPLVLHGGTGHALSVDFTTATLNGPINLMSNINVWVDDATLTVNGAITDGAATAGLTKVGGERMFLNGNNAYDGPTRILEGQVSLGHANALGTGMTTVSRGATLALANLNVNRPLTLGGPGTLSQNAVLSTSGTSTWAGPVALEPGSEIAVDNSLAITGDISGMGGINKTGAGTLILSGSNSSNGGIGVRAGIVRFLSSTSLRSVTASNDASIELVGSLASVAGHTLSLAGEGVSGQGALRVTGGTSTWNGPLNLNGDATLFVDLNSHLNVTGPINESFGEYSLQKTGVGTLWLNGQGNYRGGVTIAAGVLSVSDDAQLGSGPIAINGGALLYRASTTSSRNLTIPQGGRLQVGTGATLTLDGATISGGFLMGPGTLSPQAFAVFNGVTALAGSNIAPAGPSFLNAFINGGNLSSISQLTWNGGFNASSGKITVNSSTLSTSAFANDGIITINNSATLLNTDNPLTSGGGSRITINPGGTLNVSGNSLDLNGALLVNNGAISGPTNVNFGSLAKGAGIYGTVNVTDGGKFSPGNSPGAVTTGSTTWNAGGSYVVEIGDALSDSGHDFWQIDGQLILNSSAQHPFTISLASIDGLNFDDTRNYTWPVLNATGGINGLDAGEVALDVSAFKNPFAGRFFLESTSSDLLLHYSAVPEPASVFVLALFALARRRRRNL